MTFGMRLKELRAEREITQLQLSEILDTAKSNISKYEADTIEPNISMLIKLSQYFKVSVDYMLGISDTRQTIFSKHNTFINVNAETIRYWINKTGYSDEDIAEKLEISEDLLNAYCSGVSMPYDILYALSEICNVSTDCLLGLREKSRSKQNGILPFKFDHEISLRLKNLAKERNEDFSFIADIIGIEEEEVFNFFEYGFVLHIDIFVKIVEHFLVSSDYLLNKSNSILTVHQEEERLLQVFRSLNEDSRIIALSKLLELKREDDLVAAKNRFLDDSGKSSPSSGTEGGSMIG